MHLTMIVVTSLLGLAVLASAAGKLRKSSAVMASMTHVGVTVSQVPYLGVIEIAGGVGLFVGFAAVLLGRLAAAGLVLYFLGAVLAHLRVKDRFTVYAPAALLLAFAVITFLLQVQR
ncbi:MAG: DoxX family protein [Acidimicrobiales bacterium]